MDKLNDIIRNQSEYKSIREDKYKSDSKDRLSKILKKKVETTMIGALSSIEEHFAFLWTSSDGQPMSFSDDLTQDDYALRNKVSTRDKAKEENISDSAAEQNLRRGGPVNRKGNTMKKKKQVEKTIKKEDGSEIKIIVKKPNNNTIKASDREKAKVWNECLLDNILTKKELDMFMEQRNIWNKDKQDEEQKISKSIGELERKLYRGEKGKRPSVSRGKELALEMREKRLELLTLISERNALQENTAESLADNAKFDYLIACCTFKEDGTTPVFKTLDEYNENNDNDLAFAAGSALGELMYNLDPDFEMTLPENKFLKKFDLIDKEGALCDTEGKKVDLDGKSIDENGYYLDDDGNRVDKFGNPLTDDGEYEMVDYVNDLKPKKKTTRKTTAKKPEEKPEEKTDTSES